MGCQPGMLDLLLTPMDTTRHQSGDDGQCVMTPVDTSHSRVHVLSAGVMRLWGYLCFLPWGSLSWPESPLFPPLGGVIIMGADLYARALGGDGTSSFDPPSARSGGMYMPRDPPSVRSEGKHI